MRFSAQLRAARGLLGWSQNESAEAARVGLSTIRRMETSDGPLRGTAENVWKVQKALEDAGVIFIDADEDGPGVRLKGGRTGS
jgi:transcriptional regulator with XRE-family HTH domain